MKRPRFFRSAPPAWEIGQLRSVDLQEHRQVVSYFYMRGAAHYFRNAQKLRDFKPARGIAPYAGGYGEWRIHAKKRLWTHKEFPEDVQENAYWFLQGFRDAEDTEVTQ